MVDFELGLVNACGRCPKKKKRKNKIENRSRTDKQFQLFSCTINNFLRKHFSDSFQMKFEDSIE